MYIPDDLPDNVTYWAQVFVNEVIDAKNQTDYNKAISAVPTNSQATPADFMQGDPAFPFTDEEIAKYAIPVINSVFTADAPRRVDRGLHRGDPGLILACTRTRVIDPRLLRPLRRPRHDRPRVRARCDVERARIEPHLWALRRSRCRGRPRDVRRGPIGRNVRILEVVDVLANDRFGLALVTVEGSHRGRRIVTTDRVVFELRDGLVVDGRVLSEDQGEVDRVLG